MDLRKQCNGLETGYGVSTWDIEGLYQNMGESCYVERLVIDSLRNNKLA